MVFYPPRSFPPLPSVPDSIPISEFMLDERYGRSALSTSLNPFTCGLSGRTHSWLEVLERVDYLARGIARELAWQPNKGTEWDKVVGCFLLNTIDTIALFWAIHRLSGIAFPANAAYSAQELAYQLKDSGAKALFTCLPVLNTSLETAELAGIPRNHVYLVDLPSQVTGNATAPAHFKTLEQLIKHGRSLPPLEAVKWSPGQGARTTAFLCYSSGTSGLPKGVMISHHNIIANILQINLFEKPSRDHLRAKDPSIGEFEVSLGLLPQSHIYSLVYICHAGPYRGDEVVILPKFEINSCFGAIQRFKIAALIIVPPIIITMLRNQELLKKFDLSSVRSVFTGAAPLGPETAQELQNIFPTWAIRQGYGLTETAVIVCATTPLDIWFGSCGNLLPGVEARILTPEGQEIHEHDTPGQLVENFEDGWMHTGDEAMIRVGPNNTEHVWILDRIKELIKVKGLQVAPAELETHLLEHPMVADCAVIGIPDEAAGEIPKAFVVKAPETSGHNDTSVAQDIKKHVEDHKARHKWLKGGIEIIDVIPKSPSGKILRRLLRDK
ncbi:phenylacetyl-CoA ligase, putative [Paecilomyces variotii No. 5]|uniref:Phenylacetyl-CoA ligase, putative n=1 Tax=Byssochlamys spectabilis (strain No. 5 / NBRC 109023) TaxID=1356009 RepID=V5FPT3_BYSSN|nr:phenylacetyl-CoA ligase, putative [Paecilomyces variotii No. 5]